MPDPRAIHDRLKREAAVEREREENARGEAARRGHKVGATPKTGPEQQG